MVWLGVFVGSTVGGFVPILFGASVFSLWTVVGSGIGGIIGIWAGLRLGSE